MASLIESVRKLHGPTLVEHDNGYDVDVICTECTHLRTEALERATTDGEDWGYAAEVAHVPYPCNTRVVAGTTVAEGKDESARMRLEHLVVQREELEERMERLDAVIGLIRRSLGENIDAISGANDGESESDEDAPAKAEETAGARGTESDHAGEQSDDGYDF